jgi:hypothetical protein
MKTLLLSLLLLTSLSVAAQNNAATATQGDASAAAQDNAGVSAESDVVLMATLPSNIFTAGEQRDIEVKIANNSGHSLKGKTLIWALGNMEGDMTIPDGEGLITVGTIPFVAPLLHTRCDLLLYLFIYNTNYRNTYKVWIYPSEEEKPISSSEVF